MSYDAIVLAGGFGTRLRSTVPHLPKVLAFVNGRPFLDILIEQIECSGIIQKVVVALGHKADAIIDHYREKDFKFSIEKEPLGTGGAVAKAIKYTKSSEVFVFNGDSFCACSLKKMAESHRGILTLACAQVQDISAYGQIELDQDRRVKLFSEKKGQGSGLINGGIYLFDRTVFDKTLPKVFSLEEELIPRLIDRGITGFVNHGIFIDIGTAESYHKAQAILKRPQ